MNVLVALEHRFDRTPDGAVWTHAAFAHPFWARYRLVFDQVRVLARVRDVAAVPSDRVRADGDGVSFAAVPYYVGPWQYLKQGHRIRRGMRDALCVGEGVILRVPSHIAASLEPSLHQQQYPYGVEVVGDPYDVFAPGAVKHPLRSWFRWLFTRRLRRQCGNASAAAYVTEHSLQQRYPAPRAALVTHYSSIDLPTSALVPAARAVDAARHACTLLTVGSLAQLYKAPDVLIDAVAACIQAGLDLRLVIVGDGKHRPELEQRVKLLGLGQRVSFVGQLPAGEAVRAHLDQADLFVLPSRTEGLPRAMIEAMARGLPCVGSRVGGIPELLPPEDLVPPNNVAALAQKIRQVVADPQRMAQMGARNLETATRYQEDVLRERQITFYRHVKDQTEAWLAHQGRP